MRGLSIGLGMALTRQVGLIAGTREEAAFQDTFDSLSDSPILRPTEDLSYTSEGGSLSNTDINKMTVSSWGGVESVYNSHDPADANRALGWYSSGAGKTMTLRCHLTVPAGMVSMRVQFDFYLAWARFVDTTGRFEALRITSQQDPATLRHTIDNLLVDGASKFATTWYHPSDWTPGTSAYRQFDQTFTAAPGANYIEFQCSFAAGSSHPTLPTSAQKNIHAAIDNLVVTFA